MILPGIKKIRDHFNLQDDGTFVFGTVKNSYVHLCDGHNCKILYLRAPTEISEQTGKALNKFSEKPYKAKVRLNTQSVSFTFYEFIAPYSWKKICEVLEGSARIIYNANPELEADTSESELGAPASIAKKATNFAQVLSIIAAIIFAGVLRICIKEYKSARFASGMAQAMNAECPVQAEDIRLDTVTSKGYKVYLNYTFTFEISELDESAQQTLKEEFIKNLKENELTEELYRQTIWFFLTYHDLDGNELFQTRILPVDYK